jgi:hypothetical protein
MEERALGRASLKALSCAASRKDLKVLHIYGVLEDDKPLKRGYSFN